MSDMEKANEKVGFKSKMGFILAAAGSAIGLGNLWKFPYMAGKNGGGTFVLVYLACVVLIGLGVLSIEFIIGRNGGVNAIDCYGKHKKGFKIVGYLGVVGIMLLLSFYAIIGGWTVAYIFKAITGNLIGLSPEQLGNSMGKLFSSPGQLVIYQILFLLATAFIVAKGIASGIEKYCNILMPILFVLLVVLGIRSLTLPGATDGFVWLFKPDFSKLNGKTVVAALGQVFLSLSIGSTGMVCYAAYMKKEEKILRTSLQVAIADTLVALLGGIVIIPAVFAFGLEPSAGPTLVFITLPQVFDHMPLGVVFAVVFFFLMFVAAITSSINMLEVWVSIAVDKKKISRPKATVLCAAIAFVVGIPSLMSFGAWSKVMIFGMNIMDFFDYATSNVIFPLVGLLGAILVGYFWDKKTVVDEITNEGALAFKGFNLWYALVRYIVPVVLGFIFLRSIGVIKI